MTQKSVVRSETLAWLLEPSDPGVRYLTLRDLCHSGGEELEAARKLAYELGPIATVLRSMQPEGYWDEPGPGYFHKYTSTVWAIILLAQLGASGKHDERIRLACEYLMDHALTSNGQFTISGTPSGTIDCLQGNLCWSLRELEVEDPRLDRAYDWMARSVTGEGIPSAGKKVDTESESALRYYAGKCGPLFACGANNRQSCAWGGVKVMMALGKVLPERRTPLIERAISDGAAYLLDHQPAQAGWSNGYSKKPSGNWWKFGFPVFYVTDLLQVFEAAVTLGFGQDLRLSETVQLILDKQDAQGRWALEYDYANKTHGQYGLKGQPNKWVTLRALRSLSSM